MLLFITVLLFSNAVFAQKTVSEATLKYNISIEPTNDKPELSKSLEGASMTLYIKGSQSRSDMVSALGTESNIFDSRSGKGTILKEYSGQKLMITLSRENWAQKNQSFQNMQFNIDNTEQMIAGFKCRKATGTAENGKTVLVYFTSEVVLSNTQYNNAFSRLPGIPVQYEIESGKLKFKYVLTNINYDPVPSAKFDIPKSGYRVMTYEENQQLRKAGK